MPEKYIIVLLCFDKDLYICASLNLLIEKTMKKIILLFLVVCNCLICSSTEISKEVLTANTWKVIYPDFHGNQTHIFKFNSSNTLELKVTFHFNNRTHLIYYDYYFTDVNPKTFDLEKNAEKRSGRYIVVKNKKYKDKNNVPSFCWKIISTDKNIIEFRDEVGQKWILERQ